MNGTGLRASLRMVLLLVGGLSPRVVLAQPPDPPPAPFQPRATVLDLSGRVQTGRLLAADLAQRVRLAVDGKMVEVPAAGLLWLSIDAKPEGGVRPQPWFDDRGSRASADQPPPTWAKAWLRDGQVFVGALTAGEPDSLAIEHRWLGRLALPFGRLREVRIRVGPAAAPPAPPPLTAGVDGLLDSVLLANGDQVEGIVRSIGPGRTDIESASGQVSELSSASVHVVRFARTPAVASAPASQPAAGQAWVHLTSGERIRAGYVSLEATKGQVGAIWEGRKLTIGLAELVGVEPVSPRWRWLSTLEPAGYEHRPLLAPPLAWQADATAAGAPIRWNGQPVMRGVGVPAGSTLRYDLDGRWHRLIVWPVLDDSADRVGSCEAAIRVDGRQAWSGGVEPFADPSPAIVDLAGKRQLVLEVVAGESADVLDRFVWAWAVLIK